MALLTTITLKLDRPRRWRFSLNAQLRLMRLLGDDAMEQMEKLTEPETSAAKLELLRALIWCGLTGEDAELSIEQVGECLDTRSLPGLVESLVEAFTAANVAAEAPADGEGGEGSRPPGASA